MFLRVTPRICTFLISFSLVCPSLSAQLRDDARAKAQQELEQWRQSRATALLNDFGEVARYRDADAKLGPAAPGENRVVFLGDSITDSWDLAKYFPGKPYINRGISGQTTPQILLRFRQDVVNLRPAIVVILAGTNDIAGNTGPMTLEEIEANYASIIDLARVSGIVVLLSSVTPVNNYTEEAAKFFPLRSPGKILELNRWMNDYCAKSNCIYVDYFSAMVDDKGLLKRNLAKDGLHPNDAGYKVMAPIAEHMIENVLKRAQDKSVKTR
jgi:lysophospholipase L1-like esterase